MSALRAVLHRLSPKHLQQLATAEQQARALRAQNDVAGPAFQGPEWRRRAALPLSDAVLHPRPEPVVPARKDELEPLFQHLRTAEVRLIFCSRNEITYGTSGILTCPSSDDGRVSSVGAGEINFAFQARGARARRAP